MEEPLALLKAKLTRVVKSGDEASLAFVTTLLTAGGQAQKQYDTAFYGYRREWGERTSDAVRERLKEEGVVVEDEQRLCLNYPEWESLSFEEREAVSRDLAAWLFRESQDFYKGAIARIVSVPEGRYILSELLRAGQHHSESTVSHLERVAGSYFREVERILVGAGLFVHTSSSKKHMYYRLFPPLLDVPFSWLGRSA